MFYSVKLVTMTTNLVPLRSIKSLVVQVGSGSSVFVRSGLVDGKCKTQALKSDKIQNGKRLLMTCDLDGDI